VGTLSGGQKQRLAMACALVGDPELLFLDEPTTGLDPQARRHLWDLVEKLKRAGRTIILTTHYMEEAEQLCDRVAIMDHGKVIALGTPNELIAKECSEDIVEFAVGGSAVAAVRLGAPALPPKQSLDGAPIYIPIDASHGTSHLVAAVDNDFGAKGDLRAGSWGLFTRRAAADDLDV
jgi:ABC-2 type transport system ATP-binding protein